MDADWDEALSSETKEEDVQERVKRSNAGASYCTIDSKGKSGQRSSGSPMDADWDEALSSETKEEDVEKRVE